MTVSSFRCCGLSILGTSIVLGILFPAGRLAAQPDLFGDALGGLAPPAAEPAAPADGGGTEAAEPPQETDPAVQAIRESAPQTAAELTRAVALLLQLGRPQEAKGYLDRLAAASLDPSTLAELQQQFGSALFVALSRRPELQPEGAAWGQAVLEAAYQAARDPQRLAGLVADLSSESAVRRQQAILRLQQVGDAGLAALVGALADPADARQAAAVSAALQAWGEEAVEPLRAAMAAEAATVRTAALNVLGQLGTTRALPELLGAALAEHEPASVRQAARAALRRLAGQVPTQAAAVALLESRLREALRAAVAPPLRVDSPPVKVWRWDAGAGTVQIATLPAAQAALERAAALAGPLQQLSREGSHARDLARIARLEAAQRARGAGHRLPTGAGTALGRLAAAGPAAAERILARALRNGYDGAALATLQLLGDGGTPALLRAAGSRPSTLASALRHENPWIRQAAAAAIGRLDPREPYAGSSLLLETLAYFAGGGQRRALVAHPRLAQARTLAGWLADLGFQAEPATTGQAALQAVRSSPDYELVLVSGRLQQPPLAGWLQQLRQDPRTAHLPVGMLASSQQLADLERRTASDPWTLVFPQPRDPERLRILAQRLLERGAAARIEVATRRQLAVQSLARLAQFAQAPQRYPFYDLLRHEPVLLEALYDPGLSAAAAAALGGLATPAAQRALLDVASQRSRPLEDRQAAARAFALATQRRGLLLTRAEILQQYDRYNRSATADRQTQQVLGALLDAIEAPRGAGPPRADERAADS